MFTVYRIRAYFDLMRKDNAEGWKQLQMLWTKDMLGAFILGFLFALTHWALSNIYVDVAFAAVCFVLHVLLWKRRSVVFPEKYTWWRGWCNWVIAPYDIVIFAIAFLLFLWVL